MFIMVINKKSTQVDLTEELWVTIKNREIHKVEV